MPRCHFRCHCFIFCQHYFIIATIRLASRCLQMPLRFAISYARHYGVMSTPPSAATILHPPAVSAGGGAASMISLIWRHADARGAMRRSCHFATNSFSSAMFCHASAPRLFSSRFQCHSDAHAMFAFRCCRRSLAMALRQERHYLPTPFAEARAPRCFAAAATRALSLSAFCSAAAILLTSARRCHVTLLHEPPPPDAFAYCSYYAVATMFERRHAPFTRCYRDIA